MDGSPPPSSAIPAADSSKQTGAKTDAKTTASAKTQELTSAITDPSFSQGTSADAAQQAI